MRHFMATGLALGAMLALFGTGCHSTYYSFCESQQQCSGGNDKDIDACVQSAQGQEEIAEAYDCEDAWDKYVDCIKDKASCKNGSYDTSSCKTESDALSSCKKAASGKK